VDFGISKSAAAPADEAEEPPRLTQTGMVLGTPPLHVRRSRRGGEDELDARVR